MRVFSIVTALMVAAIIYIFVFQRELIYNFSASQSDQESEVRQTSVTAVQAKQIKEKKIVSVVVLKSHATRVDSTVLVRGETRAARQVNLMAETSGSVVSTPLRKGSFVSAGQPMCEIDAGTRGASLAETKASLAVARARVPEAEARVVEAKARLDEALINDRAAIKLSKGGFASETRVASTMAATQTARAGVAAAQSGLQSTIAGIQSAEAAVASADKEIERLVIHASFDGILESDTAELGSLMQTGTLCATVIQLDPIKLVGFVPELEVNRIQVGALAGTRLADGTDVSGKITFISRAADKLTRTFQIEVTLPNPDLRIRDGQTAEIIITAEGKQAHLLPGSSLTLNNAGTLGVRLVGLDNIVSFVPVKLLRDTINGVWVSGLGPEADVIIVGQEFVVAGVVVNPSYKETSK